MNTKEKISRLKKAKKIALEKYVSCPYAVVRAMKDANTEYIMGTVYGLFPYGSVDFFIAHGATKENISAVFNNSIAYFEKELINEKN